MRDLKLHDVHIKDRAGRFWRRFQPALALTLAISFLAVLYGPLELYFTNTDEFLFDFGALFPELLKLFLLFTAAGLAAFGFCDLLYDKLYDTALVAAAVGYVCTYIQGMFFSGNLPPLDGTRINWADYGRENLQSLLIWFVVGVAVVLLVRFFHMKRMYRVFTGGAAFFTAVLLVTLVTVGIQNDGLAPKSGAAVTKESAYDLSTEQNLILFVVDATDSAAFQELLDTSDPAFADILEDFTYYPNTVCAYPFTEHSIPFILEGQWYENQEDFRTFVTGAMDQSPLLSALRNQDYRMGVYEEDLLYDSDNIYQFENVQPTEYQFTSFRALAKAELKLVWFKYAPYPLKKMAKINMEDFHRLVQLEDSVELFSANNQDFYQDLLNAEVTPVADKCFRFIHIEGAHVPFRYDRDVNLIDEAQGSYPQNIQCSMTIVKTYLQKLKDAGVYDNSAIVILADHGYGYNRDVAILGRGNPLLAVKGVGEHHPMATSQAPISYEDLQEAYQRLLRGTSGDLVFDAREGDDRPRRFLCYYYEKDETMLEYEQQGHAFDITTMVPTGQVYTASGPSGRGPGSKGGPAKP